MALTNVHASEYAAFFVVRECAAMVKKYAKRRHDGVTSVCVVTARPTQPNCSAISTQSRHNRNSISPQSQFDRSTIPAPRQLNQT
jgi:hypothetical protein